MLVSVTVVNEAERTMFVLVLEVIEVLVSVRQNVEVAVVDVVVRSVDMVTIV